MCPSMFGDSFGFVILMAYKIEQTEFINFKYKPH